MTEMTEERLAAYRGLRDQIRETGEDDEFADAVDEIDRLRAELAAKEAENERLREVLRDIAYNTSTSIPFAAPPETFIVGQLHSCIGKAARALNPEPASRHGTGGTGMTEMTEERLAAYRGLRDQIRETGEDDEFADAVDEIDRLRAELAAKEAENERLREVLRDIAYNTSTSIPFAAPPETFIVGQLHSCIGKAARALNPEPAS